MRSPMADADADADADAAEVEETPPAAEDAEAPPADEAPSRRRRMARAVRRGGARFANGIPAGFVAALAALVLVAILFTVASDESGKPRGYVELTLFPDGCLIDQTKTLNAFRCQVTGPRTYRVLFTESLKGSTPIASRGSCCPGSIGASIESDRIVTIALLRRVKTATRVSVLLP
jgi:hypothetical protein